MRPPAPRTPMRKVSLAPSTRLDARAVSPPAIRKLRRFGGYCMPTILAIPAQRGKRPDPDWLFTDRRLFAARRRRTFRGPLHARRLTQKARATHPAKKTGRCQGPLRFWREDRFRRSLEKIKKKSKRAREEETQREEEIKRRPP